MHQKLLRSGFLWNLTPRDH